MANLSQFSKWVIFIISRETTSIITRAPYRETRKIQLATYISSAPLACAPHPITYTHTHTLPLFSFRAPVFRPTHVIYTFLRLASKRGRGVISGCGFTKSNIVKRPRLCACMENWSRPVGHILITNFRHIDFNVSLSFFLRALVAGAAYVNFCRKKFLEKVFKLNNVSVLNNAHIMLRCRYRTVSSRGTYTSALSIYKFRGLIKINDDPRV